MTITSFHSQYKPQLNKAENLTEVPQASSPQVNLQTPPDIFTLRFGATPAVQTDAARRVENQAQLQAELDNLKTNGNRHIALTASKDKRIDEGSEITVGESEVIEGLLEEEPFMKEEYAFKGENPLNFYQTGNIPPRYQILTDADVRLCSETAKYLKKELNRERPVNQVLDLGSGGDEFKKATIFLNALREKSWIHGLRTKPTPLVYIPTDLDDEMLRTASQAFLRNRSMNHVKIATLVGDFEDTIPLLPAPPLPNRQLYLFLGLTIGNMPAGHLESFAQYVSNAATPGSFLVVSYANAPRKESDEVSREKVLKDQNNRIAIYSEKPIEDMLMYNFDVVNEILEKNGGHGFDKSKWEYEVTYNEARSRVERKVKCKDGQKDTIRFSNDDKDARTFKGRDIDKSEGDRINLGFTRQFTPEEIQETFKDFDMQRNYIDDSQYVGMMILKKKEHIPHPRRPITNPVTVST